MKKNILLFAFLSAFVVLNAQNQQPQQEVKTKFSDFTARAGIITSFEDYNQTSITTFTSSLKMKKRIVKKAQEQKVFFILEMPKQYFTRSSAIADEDMTDLMNAITTLENDAKIDITTPSQYMEKYYQTNDNFKIGYYISNGEAKWYLDLDTRLSESTFFIKDIDDFVTKLIALKN